MLQSNYLVFPNYRLKGIKKFKMFSAQTGLKYDTIHRYPKGEQENKDQIRTYFQRITPGYISYKSSPEGISLLSLKTKMHAI